MGTASKLVAAIISPFAGFIGSVASDLHTLKETERTRELLKPTDEEMREAMEDIVARRKAKNR